MVSHDDVQYIACTALLVAVLCHLPNGITQCYLPPDTSEHSPP